MWLTLEEKMPKLCEDIIVYDGRNVRVCTVCCDGVDIYFRCIKTLDSVQVKCWMAMPKPPCCK